MKLTEQRIPRKALHSNNPDESAVFFPPLLSDALILVLILTLSFVSPSVGASGTWRKRMRNSGKAKEGNMIISTQPFLQKTVGLH